MHEGTVIWAATRTKAALEALDAHDKENRRLLEIPFEQRKDVYWGARDDERRDLVAQTVETSRVLLKVVLG